MLYYCFVMLTYNTRWLYVGVSTSVTTPLSVRTKLSRTAKILDRKHRQSYHIRLMRMFISTKLDVVHLDTYVMGKVCRAMSVLVPR